MLISLRCGAQQDPIFTSYMYNGQIINPAYAGMWEKIGFTTLVRKQWAGINRSPLTEYISFHSPLRNDAVGVGLNIMNDTFGREKRLTVLGDYAYEVFLTPRTRMRMGVKFGFTNYKNPLTEYILYPDGKYDRAFDEDVDLKFLPNFGFGIFIYQDYFYAGFSIPKFLQNDFENGVENYDTNYELRHMTLIGGYVFEFSDAVKFASVSALGNRMRSDIGFIEAFVRKTAKIDLTGGDDLPASEASTIAIPDDKFREADKAAASTDVVNRD